MSSRRPSATLSTKMQTSSLARAETPWRRTWRLFRRHELGVVGAAVLAIILLAAVLAPLIEAYPPDAVDLDNLAAPPNPVHWLGTDRTGRDNWSRLVHGGRASLAVGFVAVSIASGIGLVLGIVSGFFGGWADLAIQRVTDLVMTFPSLVIILTLVALLGPSLGNIMLVLGLLGWPVPCRIVRAQVLSLRAQEYVVAARAAGATNARLMRSHILPGTLAPLLVYTSFGVANAMLTEAGLSFLGLGVQPPMASWGNMLNAARSLSILEGAPWVWLPPGLLIGISVLAINSVGDALRDVLDPRSGGLQNVSR